MKSSLIIVGAIAIASSAIIYSIVSSDNDNLVTNQIDKLITAQEKKLEDLQKEAEVLAPVGLSRSLYTASNLETGYIGINAETNIDNPHDNTFHIILDGEIESGRQAWLEYDLYGAEDYTSVSRAINDQVAFGGAFVKLSQDWSVQREKIDASQLHKGDNIIRFSIPGNSDFNYIVKNVRIRFDDGVDASRRIVLNQPMSKSYYNRYGYISGFVNGYGSEHAKIFANGKPVRSNQSVFEGIVDQIADHGSDWKAVITAVFEDGQTISDTAHFCNPATCDFTNEISTDLAFSETKVNAQMPVHMSVPGFELNGEPGSVSNNVKLSVTGLRAQDMALPRLAMVNVTGGSDGYRCLPHGNNFAKEVEVRVKYDTARIPKGYGPKDIRTFYYSEEQGDWIQLPYDTFDLASCEIISHTTHFTDFINAILKTPESPQTQAFTPTSMKDMKFADPIAHINMMSPPQANNSGTANMSYPIQIPAGRQGMQPQLAISYNSEGGNGWLGVGWGMNIPSISVETRWGVPLYSTTQETEEYLVNGQQIVELDITTNDTNRLPLIHQSTYRNRSAANEVFYSYRVEGAFDRLIRHGNSPSTYWWEVVDKQGTHYYYGKYSTDAGVNPSCVLRDTATNNIAHWALAEVRDPFGNYVKYTYDVSTFTGTLGNGGKQIYPESIVYSGFGTTDGKYSIDFEYTNGRSDYMISGKYGFLEVTNKLLTNVYVKYDNSFIRRYYILYKDGAYDKKLVCGIADISDPSISLLDLDCSSLKGFTQNGIKTHRFDYYEEEGVEFGDAVTVLSEDEYSESLFSGAYQDQSIQSIGRSKGTSTSIGGSICFGLGSPTTKLNTIGLNLSSSIGTLKDKVVLMDINGDGLTDKLVRSGTSYNLYKGYLNSSNQLLFNSSAVVISSLPNLGRNWSYSIGGGGEVQLGLSTPAGSPIISGTASISKSITYQTNNKYFVDINADGYVDYVSDGDVYFNQPTPAGNPLFIMEDNNTEQVFFEDSCYSIIHDGTIDPVFSETENTEEFIHRRDPVRMWIASEEGVMSIENYIQRVSNSAGSNYSKVKYSIQHNENIIYCDSIEPNDFQLHSNTLSSITVDKGDRIYFRLHATDKNALDDVAWDPIIYPNVSSYSSHPNYHDADDKKLFRYKYSEDFTLSDKKYFVAPLTGTVHISGSIASPAQSDNLLFNIRHNTSNVYSTTYTNNTAFSYSFSYNVNINAGDSILFELLSHTNVDWSSVSFDAEISYTSASGFNLNSNNQFTSVEYKPSLFMSVYGNQFSHTLPYYFSSGSYFFYPSISLTTGSTANGTITFTAKSKHKLLAKKQISIINGVVQSTLFNNRINVSLATGDSIYFDFHTSNPELFDDVTSIYAYLKATTYQSGFHAMYPDSMRKFGHFYRSWGQFSYFDNNIVNNCMDPIDESSLNISALLFDTAALSQFPIDDIDSTLSFDEVEDVFEGFGVPDINSLSFSPMSVDEENNRWIDFCVSAYTESLNLGSGASFQTLYSNVSDATIFEPDDSDVPDFFNPVPSSNSCGYVRTVSKNSRQISKSFSYSLSPGPMNFSHTKSENESFGRTDFMDINGDRFPDIVAYNKIQYSTPQGGISDATITLNDIFPSHGTATSEGSSFGVKPTLKRIERPIDGIKSKMGNVDGSFGVGFTNGSSNVDYIYIDVNGDGLADRVDKTNNRVFLNIGDGFHNPEQWNVNQISSSTSVNTSINLGASMFNYSEDSWAGGIGGSSNVNTDDYSMMDINGDGLTDVCFIDAGEIYAYVNTGHGYFLQPLNNSFLGKLGVCRTNNVSGNIANTGGILIWIFKITFSGYFDASYNLSSQEQRLSDLNGDGFLDYVYIDNGDIKVNYGIPKKINLLKCVTTPVQSAYTIDYAMTYPNRENPQSKWVLSSLLIYDGFTGDGENLLCYKFEYDSAFYHRMERESFGFETVTTKQFRNFSVQNCYRYSVEKYLNDDYMFKGLKYYEVNYDSLNHKYVETYYTWSPKEISTGTIVSEDSMQCFGPYYPAISQEDKYFYEGLSAFQIHTRKTYRHTRFGNVREYKNFGDVAYTSDDFTATITYSYNIPSNLLALVSQIDVRDVLSNLLQRRNGSYNGYGRISQIGSFDGSNTAYTDILYDSYGNISNVQFPENVNYERLSYTYVYDPFVHTYPVSVTDYWGNTSYTQYDYKLGAPLIVTDLTGNEMHYSYYDDGKLNTVTGPNEILASIPYTIKCEYWDETGAGMPSTLWARTRHYDPINTNNEFVTVNFSDGVGRSIQSKQKATVNGIDSMVVSGKVYYDAFGRAYRTSLPVAQALGSDSVLYSFTPTVFASTTFDYLDRPLLQTAFDNTTISYSYGFGQDAFGKMCFKSRVTDPNSISTDNFTNARGLNTSVTAPLNTITKFIYTPLGYLLRTIDPESNVTNYKYNMLGKLTFRGHPDAGATEYNYDLAGNVLTTQTANLAGGSQYIQYNYSECRLDSIVYPQNPEMNVYYEYGAPNIGNQSSRLIRQQDASGVQTFEYGNMGELIKNIHTFVVPNGNPYTLETDWEYDSWNRMKSILYPDGELVSYHYDNGGKLSRMDAVKGSATFNYIDSVQYNLFGSRSRIDYGNGTYTQYIYEPLNQRLSNLESREASGLILQTINYNYDNLGNITSISNASDNVGYGNDMGGQYSMEYTYDELYRLSTSTGNFESYNFGQLTNSLSMSYSSSGNILSKEVYADVEIGGSVQTLSYSNTYTYSNRPHAVTSTGANDYEWDANGNLTRRYNSSNGRYLCWDEENRLTTVHNGGEDFNNLSSYIYNAGGERTWKLTGEIIDMYINGQMVYGAVDFEKTLYASPYLVVTDEGYTKHFFIEGERVCSKIGSSGWIGPLSPNSTPVDFIVDTTSLVAGDLWTMVKRGADCSGFDSNNVFIGYQLQPFHIRYTAPETNLYFYHPDHLGSSSFITDATGYAVQHLQYLPFGETFVDQQNGYDSRYTFSAKEKDDETQYSYFGARYYDSDLSVWLSVDPLSDKYPSMSSYMYCAGNPVMLVDPDGRRVISPWDRIIMASVNNKLTSHSNSFTKAASLLFSEYFSDGHMASVHGVHNGSEIISIINSKKNNSIKSLDIISHSGPRGIWFAPNSDGSKNNLYQSNAIMNDDNGSSNYSGSIESIDFGKFSNDARIELHGCATAGDNYAEPNGGPEYTNDNIALDMSKSLYKAGKNKAYVIGHFHQSGPDAAGDYRQNTRVVYYNGNEVYKTTEKGNISHDKIQKAIVDWQKNNSDL